MFLTGDSIRTRSEELFPQKASHFSDDSVSQASYDLRVGDEVFLSEKRIPTHLGQEAPYVILPPGQFALVKTYEEIFIPPDLIGLLSIRSTYKFQGLINISGFHVDPTYKGHLIFAVQNVGPNDIRLRYREPVFMLMLAKLTEEYKGGIRKPGYDRIPLEHMAQLGGPSVTLTTLKSDLNSVSLTLKIYGALAVALFGAIIGALLRWLK
jgi:dCTP deaminase